jgi:hypothetical protein
MENTEEVLKEFGKRIQRCYGCFIAYHLKDMYLGEDVTFFANTARTRRCSTSISSPGCWISQSSKRSPKKIIITEL